MATQYTSSTSIVDRGLNELTTLKILGLSVGAILAIVAVVSYVETSILQSSYYRASLAELSSKGFADPNLEAQAVVAVQNDTGITL